MFGHGVRKLASLADTRDAHASWRVFIGGGNRADAPLLVTGDLTTQTSSVSAHVERAFEREDPAKQGSETLLQMAMPRICDPPRAARPSEMQRSRIPLSSPISVCICRARMNSARSMGMSMSMNEDGN